MTPTAAYDEIADWYEREFLATDGAGHGSARHRRRRAATCWARVSGTCLEIGCGTGVHAAQVSELGWTPVGIDLSGAMLRHARGRLPVAMADAARLPVARRQPPRGHRGDGAHRHARLPGGAARGRAGAAPGRGARAHRRASVLLRRVRRPRRPAAPWSSAPVIWTGTGRRRRGPTRASGTRSGATHFPLPEPAACVPRRRPGAGAVRRGRRAGPGRARCQGAQAHR